MRMLLAAVAAALTVATCATPAWADAGVQPVGSVPIPDGPAQTWLIADLDSAIAEAPATKDATCTQVTK